MENGTAEYKITLESCFKSFQQSFNRVKYFSCITSNLDLEILPTDWGIQNPSGLSYSIKKPETNEQKQMILDGYKHFIHCYLVRDSIESFAASLDYLFLTLLLHGKKVRAKQSLWDSLSAKEQDLMNEFEGASLSSKAGKFQLLKKHFNVELEKDFKKIIPTLKDIRNCFSHGNGFVRKTDGKKDGKGKRKFIWKTAHVFAKGIETGTEYPIEFGQPFKEEVHVCLQIKDHEKSFEIGDQLSFTPAETYEIAVSLQQVAKNLIKRVHENLC